MDLLCRGYHRRHFIRLPFHVELHTQEENATSVDAPGCRKGPGGGKTYLRWRASRRLKWRTRPAIL